MNSEDLGNSGVLNMVLKPAGWLMGSRIRQWIFDPNRTLEGAELQPGQTVLEVGCGTGFFTIPAAGLVGETGTVIAMDVMVGYLDEVATRVADARLANVQILRRDALKTGLADASVDIVLLFGVLPFPSLPLKRLLPEMHRVLKPTGSLALWQFPVAGWVPGAIARSGLFASLGKRNGVYRYART